MKVLQINAVYEKYSTGRLMKELHEELLNRGEESFIASPDIGSLTENAYKIGNSLSLKLHSVFSWLTGLQGYFSHIETLKLIKYIKQIKPDIIHLGNLHSNYINLSMLLKFIAKNDIATVLTLHDSWFYTGKCCYYIEFGCDKWQKECGKCVGLSSGNKTLFLDRSKKALQDKKVLFGSIKRLSVIGVSKWISEDAKKSILKNAADIRCIYNWIDLETFSAKDATGLRNSLGLEDKKIILGIAANWVPQKGSAVFNKLAEILPDEYRILLIGDTSPIENLSSKIISVGVVKDPQRLADYYSLAYAFINPSIQETFGLTTAEAMACGTPVIAYNATATPELLGEDGSCGYLINENIAESYYEKILSLNEENYESLSANARKRAEKLFSEKDNIEEYINAYKRLIS